MSRHIGRHRMPQPRQIPRGAAAPAGVLGDVAIAAEGLFTVLRHLADGRTCDDAWALGEIDAHDMRAHRDLVTS